MVKFLVLLLLTLPLVACQPEGAQSLPTSPLTIITVGGEEVKLDVEVAVTIEQKSIGLMNRKKMRDDHGMLFYFTPEQPLSFWMKNTLIPLDLIFIKSNGVIHHIHKNAIPHDETPISSRGNASAVLEINGGLSEKLNIEVGDKVQHRFFNKNSAQ